jgi:hypothetical protein
MFLALSFIGILPSYIVECVHQIRCYFDGEVYLILDDLISPYIASLEKYNIILIPYDSVRSHSFDSVVQTFYHKFCIVHGLSGREKLFIRSFERLFLLQNLMKLRSINDCLFLELDNLIYDDPRNWLSSFSKNELCYMYDDTDRFASGIMYVKSPESIVGLLNYIIHFISNSNSFLTEMTVLAQYYNSNIEQIQILPTHWTTNNYNIPSISYHHYSDYNDTIFDAASIGIYLLGMDPYHTDGKIVTGLKGKWSGIDFTHYNFEWKIDENGRKKPYVFNGEKWILINNLHVHSKNLRDGLSLQI